MLWKLMLALIIALLVAACAPNPKIGQATAQTEIGPVSVEEPAQIDEEANQTPKVGRSENGGEKEIADISGEQGNNAQEAAPSGSAGACVLDSFTEAERFGVQLQVNQRNGADWEFDPMKASRVPGDTAHPELAMDADLSGCPVIFEGRDELVQEHLIWVLMPGDTRYLDSDGIFRAKEGSAYAYPTNWNMEDFSSEKTSIAGEFVTKKRNAQVSNDYNWLIRVYTAQGTVLVFEAGKETPRLEEAVIKGNCTFNEPKALNVTGVYTSGSFNASIGAEGCWTVSRLDGTVVRWKGPKDNVTFKKVAAYLMPGSWTDVQIQAWNPPQ